MQSPLQPPPPSPPHRGPIPTHPGAQATHERQQAWISLLLRDSFSQANRIGLHLSSDARKRTATEIRGDPTATEIRGNASHCPGKFIRLALELVHARSMSDWAGVCRTFGDDLVEVFGSREAVPANCEAVSIVALRCCAENRGAPVQDSSSPRARQWGEAFASAMHATAPAPNVWWLGANAFYVASPESGRREARDVLSWLTAHGAPTAEHVEAGQFGIRMQAWPNRAAFEAHARELPRLLALVFRPNKRGPDGHFHLAVGTGGAIWYPDFQAGTVHAAYRGYTKPWYTITLDACSPPRAPRHRAPGAPTSPPTLCMVRLGWLALALLFLLSARLLRALSSPCSFMLLALPRATPIYICFLPPCPVL